MLTALTTRSAQAGAARQVARSRSRTRRPRSHGRLDEIAKRLPALDDRTKQLEDIDKRIQALHESAKQAEQTTHEGARPGRRAAEASRGRPAPVVAGARHPGDARHAEEGARDARGTARPAARGRGRSEAVARPGEHAQERARSDPRRRDDADAGLRADPRDLARSARGHDRRDDDGQGRREQARTAGASSTS